MLTKKCACGRLVSIEYTRAILSIENTPFDGVYFNCECDSTLMIPLRKLSVEQINILNIVKNGALQLATAENN